MKTNKSCLIILTFLLIPFLLFSCSYNENNTYVTVNMNGISQVKAENSSIIDRIFNFFVPSANATTTPPWSLAKNTITITVTAPDIPAFEVPVPNTQTSYTIVIPAGLKRTITVLSYDSSNYRNSGGHITLDLEPGETTVTIRMLPITRFENDTYIGSAVTIFWGEVLPNYPSCTGFKVYRADSPEGPYQEATLPLPITDCSTLSTSPSGNMGSTYYYKVSVITPYGEGELSTFCTVSYQ